MSQGEGPTLHGKLQSGTEQSNRQRTRRHALRGPCKTVTKQRNLHKRGAEIRGEKKEPTTPFPVRSPPRTLPSPGSRNLSFPGAEGEQRSRSDSCERPRWRPGRTKSERKRREPTRRCQAMARRTGAAGFLLPLVLLAASLLDWNLISLINMIIFFATRFLAPTRGMSVMTDI